MTFNYQKDLIKIYSKVNLTIKYLRDHGLLRKFVYCSCCNNMLKNTQYKKKQGLHSF